MPETTTTTTTTSKKVLTEKTEKTPAEKAWDTRRKNKIASQQAQIAKLTEKNKQLKKENKNLKSDK